MSKYMIWLWFVLFCFTASAFGQQFTRITSGDIVNNGGNTWGCAWGDFNGDGHPDLFGANRQSENLLYVNNGDGTFTRITSGSIVQENTVSYAGTWGDYDNDGDLDLFVPNEGDNALYTNTGNGNFTAVTSGEIVNDGANSQGAAWGDYDNDGWLDLFVANNGENNMLFHNLGNGTFERITTGGIVNDGGNSRNCIWADYDNDGDLDLFVANTGDAVNFLYENQGNGNFTRVTSGAIATDAFSSQGGNWGDYDNDGDLDLYVINYGPSNGTPNNLYQNNGDGTFSPADAGDIVTTIGASFSSAWLDYDNDGWLDMIVANSGDTRLCHLYHNNGDGTFDLVIDENEELLLLEAPYHGISCADYDGDGDTDIFIANGAGENNLLYQNNGNGHNWLQVECRTQTADASTIGAKITLFTTAGRQYREVSGLTGRGGQNHLIAEFGLGMTDLIDSVRVQWLNGAVDVIPSVRVNQRLRVIEPDAYFIRWHGLEQLAETSTGVCWVDYDDDGFTDLFFTNQHGANNRLYHNNGDGTFTPVTSGDLVNDGGNSYGASWGDYDNDGLPDVVVANDGHNVLYHNEGDGNFTRVLDSPIATDGGTSLAAAWSDYNGDGWLDLVIVNYGHNFLYRNYGGTFQRVTDSVIEQDFTYSNACSWGDIDGDRDPDLFVANSGNNSLYINNGDGTFTARRHGNVVSEDGFSLSGSWCDFDRDHDLDLFVTNLEMDNFLFRNNGQGGFSRVTFGDLIDDPGYGYGASWMDANQDGLPDVFVSHGGFVGEQNNTLYLNNGNLTFSAFEESRVDKDQGASLANAWADVDNDGDPDLVVANDGNNFLYHNGGFGHNWFGAELTGTISNHPAIGSKVWIKAGGTWQMQEISAQSGGGYSAQSDRRALFGVGSATVIDSIRVDWSSGVTQYLQNVAVNQYLTISEVYDGSCLPFGVDVRLPELQAEPGANLLIPILLPCDDVAGMDILAFQMEIVFDPAVIHILDYDTHNSLTDAGWTIHINPHTPGRVILNGFSANPLPENGTLIYLRATVTGSEGQVTDLRFVDAFFNERDPICQPISGRVTVGAGGDVFTISGQVQYWQACDGTDAVPDVLLQLSNGLNTTTGEEGLYSLTSPAGVVTLSASKTGDNSGISTFDAARVAQYSAGSYDFNECQILAADVTQNGSINPFDAARIAQFAAGIEQSSVAGEWMFTPERYHYEPLQMDMPGQNFSAVLMGEVTGNWSPTFRMKNNEFGVQNQNVRIKFSNHQLQQVDPVENVIAFQFLIAGEDDLQVDLAETVPADWQLVTHRRGPVLWFVGAFGITPLQDGALLNLSESVNLSSLQLISGQINEQPVTVIPEVALPQHVALYPAYPNPFNPRTTIRFEVPQSMNVTLAVYDMSGQLVQTLMSGIVDAGSYSVQWQGDDRTGHKVSSGIYLYRLETEQQQFVRRMILLR